MMARKKVDAQLVVVMGLVLVVSEIGRCGQKVYKGQERVGDIM